MNIERAIMVLQDADLMDKIKSYDRAELESISDALYTLSIIVDDKLDHMNR